MEQVDIKGFEDYQITDDGRVWSKKNNKWLKPWMLKNDYLCVSLMKDGKKHNIRLHRIIAEAFIPNPDNKPYIDHINTIRTDNSISNLRWVSHKENMNNPITTKKMSDYNKTIKHWTQVKAMREAKIKTVYQYTKDGVLVAVYDSVVDAAKATNSRVDKISSCCVGKEKSRLTHNGFKWSYNPLN